MSWPFIDVGSTLQRGALTGELKGAKDEAENARAVALAVENWLGAAGCRNRHLARHNLNQPLSVPSVARES